MNDQSQVIKEHEQEVMTIKFIGSFQTSSINMIRKTLEQDRNLEKRIKSIKLDMSQLTYSDSNVFWVIRQWITTVHPKVQTEVYSLDSKFSKIWDTLPVLNNHMMSKAEYVSLKQKFQYKLDIIHSAVLLFKQSFLFRNNLLGRQTKLFWQNFFSNVQEIGLNIIPVLSITMFFIGIVLTIQAIFQLRMFSAELFAVDFLSISVFRELGPLLTGILLASRTGSAIAAQIGTMKINEELNMLEIMGLNITKLFILPKILALIFVGPFLTFYACIIAMLGGMLIFTTFMGDSIELFIQLFKNSMSVSSWFMFAWKGALFSLLVGIISCVQGLQVKSSSIDVGKKTTAAVVASILSILIVDGLISIITTFKP